MARPDGRRFGVGRATRGSMMMAIQKSFGRGCIFALLASAAIFVIGLAVAALQ